MTENVIKQPNVDTEATTQNLLNAYKNNEIMADILPIINSLGNNSSVQPAELMNKIISRTKDTLSLIRDVQLMDETPVIGNLAGVLAETLYMVMNVYGLLLTLHLMHFKGIPFGYDDTVKLFDEMDKNKVLTDITQLKQNMHKTADTNNPKLTLVNNASAKASDLSINTLMSAIETMKQFTLDSFINNNAETLDTVLGVNREFLDNGNDPYYLQLNSFNDIQERLNEAIVQTVRKRQTESSEEFMSQKVIDNTK